MSIIPVQDITTKDVLYGARTTTFRYELLTHDTATGADSLLGFLDGVTPGGSLRWSASASVKKSGQITVADLDTAREGMIRVADIPLASTRIRPVMVIQGLPEIPLGVYVVTAAPETWEDTGRTFEVELHDKSTVLDQDQVAETFTADTTTPILQIVAGVIGSAGEQISVDASETRTLTTPMVWEAGTTKLRIINDLLDALNYNALWVDGSGAFRATPYVRPSARSTRYTILNDDTGDQLVRELTDGEQAIYSPDWTRDQDLYGVPNRVIAVQAASGDDEPLVGVAENLNPNSPFSYPSRGRWVARTLDSVDTPDGTEAETIAFLEAKAQQALIAASSPQAKAEIESLPIPVELLDAVRFAHTPAGIDSRHTIQSVELGLAFDGLMTLNLLETVDL